MAADEKDLTTVARVKQRADVDHADFDADYQTLITEVSVLVQSVLGRTLYEKAWTHYHDGDGRQEILLREGPIVSVTSLSSIEYDDDGGGGLQETPTVIDAADYLIYGKRSEGWRGRGKLLLRTSLTTPGHRNYKVIYTAGWEPSAFVSEDTRIPQDIEHAVIGWVLATWNLRLTAGLQSKTVGDGSIQRYLTSKGMVEEIRATLGAYATSRSWVV